MSTFFPCLLQFNATFLIRFDVYSMLVRGLLVFVFPFFLRHAHSKCPCSPQNLQVAPFAGHLSWEWKSSIHQTQDFFPSDFLLSVFSLWAFSWIHSFVTLMLGHMCMKYRHEHHWGLLTFSWWLPWLRIFTWAPSSLKQSHFPLLPLVFVCFLCLHSHK